MVYFGFDFFAEMLNYFGMGVRCHVGRSPVGIRTLKKPRHSVHPRFVRVLSDVDQIELVGAKTKESWTDADET